jgi:hypothetical protein
MKINRSNRLLCGLLVAAATAPSLAFALTTGGPGGDTVTPSTQPQITVAGGATVNGPLLVQPAVTVTPGIPVVTPGAGTPTAIGGVVAGSGGNVILNQTLIDTTVNSQTATGSGGASIQTNGDTVLNAATTVTSTVNYGRAVTFQVAQAGNSNPVGLAIPGTEIYYLTSPTGTPVPGAPTFATEAALDAYIAGLTPATMLALDPTLGTSVTAAGPGGNLTVNGATSTQGIDNNGNKITELDAGTAPTDAANVGQVDAAVLVETNNRIADDVTLQNNINAEATTRAADDVTLQNNINAEATTRAADDVTLQNNINAEATTRAADDVTLQNNINAEATTRGLEDTSIRTEFRSADTAIRNEFRAADTELSGRIDNEADARVAADNALRGDIKSNRYQIDRNTRGIAMVAAMTNSTVLPGKTQVLDFNLAQFDDATGFAFGYGYRVNENLQINAAGASTTDFEEAVARLGISYQW